MTTSIRTSTFQGGAVERVVLTRPKANVLDLEMVSALTLHARSLEDRANLKLLVIEGEGNHFSYGASVEEHLPAHVGSMLAAFHELFRVREALGVPTAAIVRGNCLGGGFELALSCGWTFADDDARLGCPEVALGVFAPLASLLLPARTGQRVATQLLVSGEILEAAHAQDLGIVDDVSADPEGALWAWYERVLAPKSAVALRHAWRAARRPVARALEEELLDLEALYLRSLMSHVDPVEGISAFLAKRKPEWRHA
jgi:cyclohexa-1,5-dienecarbonyl-CoA hydratase